MPSLRRVASSPAIRPAPYAVQPTSSSSGGSLGRRRQQPLAQLPSVTGPRAVLGEMSWWQVHSGQQPEGHDASEDVFEPEPEPEPVEDDALIAEAVRIAISQHHDQDREDQPSQLGFNDEHGTGTDEDDTEEADPTPTNEVPPTSLLPLGDDDADDSEDASADLAHEEDTQPPESCFDDSDASSSPPSSPPALVEPTSPASSHTSSPVSSYPPSPVALRPTSRYKRPSPYPPPFRLSNPSATRPGRKPMSLTRTFSLDDLEYDDELFTKDMTLDEIIADLSSPTSLAAAHARFMSPPSSRPPSGSFELLPADA